MTRRQQPRCQLFMGSLDRKYKGPWSIDNRPVSRGVYRRTYYARIRAKQHTGVPLTRGSGARGRKQATDARRQWKGCDHEFEYREDTIGDYGVIGGTYIERWLECQCGAHRSASWEDAPTFDDFY